MRNSPKKSDRCANLMRPKITSHIFVNPIAVVRACYTNDTISVGAKSVRIHPKNGPLKFQLAHTKNIARLEQGKPNV